MIRLDTQPRLRLTGDYDEIYSKIRDEKFLIIAGPTGSGKTTYERLLLQRGFIHTVQKRSGRKERDVEKSGEIPFSRIDYRTWLYYDRPLIETLVTGIQMPDSQIACLKRRGVDIPAVEELVLHIPDLLMGFDLISVLTDVTIAKRQGKWPFLGLYLNHALDWKELFPNSRIIALRTDKGVLIERNMRERDLNNPVNVARLCTALAERPEDYLQADMILPNNSEADVHKNLRKIRRFLHR